MVLNPYTGMPSALEQQAPHVQRPRTSVNSSESGALKKGEGSRSRLTEYQQFFPGTPAYCRPVDTDLNREVLDFFAHKVGPKKPSLVSTSTYSECFKRPSSRQSLVHPQYPFENSKYKRHTSTPKSYSHDQQHRAHISNGEYAKVTKGPIIPDTLTMGGTCEMWASSYQRAHKKGPFFASKPVKDEPQEGPNDIVLSGKGDLPADLGVKDLWKMWCASSYQVAYQPPSSSQGDVSLRATTAPSHAQRQFRLKDHAQLPSMNAQAGRMGSKSNWKYSNALHSSTPNLPFVSQGDKKPSGSG